ncbi:MAG: RagB/SusD family nutrient uptake outer membrane protein [Alistipes sp.]|nr:RagB/SusD family nutrient uptake outer membrane protein [Alistipes sp.]
MKLKNIAIYTLMLAMATSFVACDEWLSKEPSKSTKKTLENTEQLDALLGNFQTFYQEQCSHVYGTDDWGIWPEFHGAKSGGVYNATTQLPYLLWGDEVDDARYSVWQKEYPKIYYANVAIEQAMSLQGLEEDKANLKAEGHFLRAYSMFQLAVAHTLYYTGDNGDELGLSLQTTNFEDSSARANLADTWAAIDADLQEALKITVALKGANGKNRTWRATTASVNAFAARYYLYRGDLAQAKSYAEKALAEYSTLGDYNTTMSFSKTTLSKVINSSTNEETVTVYYPSTYNTRLATVANFGKWFETEGIYLSRDCYHASWWFVPSKELVDTYAIDVPGDDKQNDLRFRYFFVEDFSLRTCSVDPAFRWYGVMMHEMESIDAGPSVAEMMLIKAEYEAREGNKDTAMSILNTLRKARIDASVYTANMTASSKDDAIKKVLQERRRELFMTMRWYDMKRLNANDYAADDITVTRQYYDYNAASGSVLADQGVKTFTLEPNSRHYAIPIPKTEIANSKGAIQQNVY